MIASYHSVLNDITQTVLLVLLVLLIVYVWRKR